MKKRELATAADAESAITVIPPSPQMDASGRINYYHRLSRGAGMVAVKAALAAGLELARIKRSFPSGKAFDEWVDANCEFGRSTSYKYMATATEALGHTDGLARLLDGSDDERREAVEEYASLTGSKSLTELYIGLGIVKKTPSNMGGNRPGAGRKRKLTLEQMQQQADALAKDPEAAWAEISALLAPVVSFIDARDGLGLIDKPHLEQLEETFRRWRARANTLIFSKRDGE